jgi:2-iminobutanoate/2-iminopropanoate deaminase
MTVRMNSQRQELRVPELSPPLSHYTDAVRCGDLLFISGCVALDNRGDIVCEGDVVGQMRKALENMQACLAAANMTFNNVVKVTVFLVDINDRAAINTVREEFFQDARPASTLVGVSELVAPELLVEIEAVAYDG